MSSGRWQAAQFLKSIGATSLLNVTEGFSLAKLPDEEKTIISDITKARGREAEKNFFIKSTSSEDFHSPGVWSLKNNETTIIPRIVDLGRVKNRRGAETQRQRRDQLRRLRCLCGYAASRNGTNELTQEISNLIVVLLNSQTPSTGITSDSHSVSAPSAT
jgi:hypothetical protein